MIIVHMISPVVFFVAILIIQQSGSGFFKSEYSAEFLFQFEIFSHFFFGKAFFAAFVAL